MHTILKQDSARVSAYDSLCEAYNRAGDVEKAVQVAEQLVELEPENSQHKDRLNFLKSKFAGPAEAPAPAAPAPAARSAGSGTRCTGGPARSRPALRSAISAAVRPVNPKSISARRCRTASRPSSPSTSTTRLLRQRPRPRPPPDLGDVIELTQEDEESIKEKLTEAEVFVRYGLVDKAIAQLLDVLESFRFHAESREKLIEIYKDQGNERRSVRTAVAALTGVSEARPR